MLDLAMRKSDEILRGGYEGERTMTSGAMIQFTAMLNKICIQIYLFRNTRCKVSNLTLQSMGYIMTSSPIAIGIETPTNFPFCKEGPVFGTKLPSMIPIAIAKKIHSARKRSSQPRLLNADVLEALTMGSSPFSSICFSTSEFGGEVVGEVWGSE